MSCEALRDRIEEIACGETTLDAAAAGHVEACPICRGRLARARAIHAMLAARPQPEPPADFTVDVLSRIRRERWRAEQWLDAGFNVAVVAGILFIVGGIVTVLWASGVAAIGGDLIALAANGTGVLVERLVRDAQAVALTIAFLTAAAGVWWWAEHDVVL